MPLPFGAHYLNSSRKTDGIRLSDGTVVTRSAGEKTGANELGYKSDRDYRANKAEGDRYVSAVLTGKQGQRDIARAREAAKARGERFDLREHRKIVLAVRNAPRDSRGRFIDRGPNSPIGRFNVAMGGNLGSDGYSAFERGEKS